MDDQETLRQVVAVGGGFGGKPEIKYVETRDREVIHSPQPNPRNTIYIPKLPQYSLTETLPLSFERDVDRYLCSEHATRIWITEETHLDDSDPLHPVLKVYGYERVYVLRVWMKEAEFDQMFPSEEEEEEDNE